MYRSIQPPLLEFTSNALLHQRLIGGPHGGLCKVIARLPWVAIGVCGERTGSPTDPAQINVVVGVQVRQGTAHSSNALLIISAAGFGE